MAQANKQDSEQQRSSKAESKLWLFLNSNFCIFILSSVVVSFITWGYTQWTLALEKEASLVEAQTKLTNEINYRIRLLDNYFDSECTEHSNLGSHTLVDIENIYTANSQSRHKAIFVENNDKALHSLIWEWATTQHEPLKSQALRSFNTLLHFNSYLGRLDATARQSGKFYGAPIDYKLEVEKLKRQLEMGLLFVQNESKQLQIALKK